MLTPTYSGSIEGKHETSAGKLKAHLFARHKHLVAPKSDDLAVILYVAESLLETDKRPSMQDFLSVLDMSEIVGCNSLRQKVFSIAGDREHGSREVALQALKISGHELDAIRAEVRGSVHQQVAEDAGETAQRMAG